jgi:phytanoyl-CoA hydroxylase
MRGVIGSDEVALWTDKINLKRPREGSGFRWHQDSPYWTHACSHVDRLPNVMVTLDDASEANGCFRVIRGSHTSGCLPGRDDGTDLGPLFTDPACFDAADEVLAEAPAGSLIFFSPHTVHGSQPNRSETPRRAMVLTYQPGGHEMFKLPGVRNAGTATRGSTAGA